MNGLTITVFAAIAFGLYPAAAKLAYHDGANACFVIIVTTFARAFALSLFCLARREPLIPTGRALTSAASGGFFQAVSIFGIIGSLAYLPGPVTIIIIFTHTIMLLLYMAYRGEAQLTRVALLTTLSALFGVSLVVDVWRNYGSLSVVGVSLALIAAVATMSRLYVFGKQVQDTDPAVVGARVFTFAALFTLLLLPFISPVAPATATGWIWVALCCLSLVLGTFGMFYAIALVGAFRFSLTIKLEPAFTALFSLLLAHEALTTAQYLGMAIVILSLISFQLLERSTK